MLKDPVFALRDHVVGVPINVLGLYLVVNKTRQTLHTTNSKCPTILQTLHSYGHINHTEQESVITVVILQKDTAMVTLTTQSKSPVITVRHYTAMFTLTTQSLLLSFVFLYRALFNLQSASKTSINIDVS